MVTEDFLVAGLIGRAERQGPLNITEGFPIFRGLELAQTAYGQSRCCIGSEFEIMRKSILGRGVCSRPVLQRSQKPPPVGPMRVQFQCLLIEFDSAGNIVCLASGYCLRGYIRKTRWFGLRGAKSSQKRDDQNRKRQVRLLAPAKTPPVNCSHPLVRGPHSCHLLQTRRPGWNRFLEDYRTMPLAAIVPVSQRSQVQLVRVREIGRVRAGTSGREHESVVGLFLGRKREVYF